MIGIVSGAGPLAGVDVAQKIIEETIAQADQEHLPVLLMSIPADIPDRSSFLLGKNDQNPGGPIGQLFLRLEQSGATVAAIACNTAHADPIFAEARRVLSAGESTLKILHIVEETVSEIEQFPSGTKVGILSTDGTRQLGLYKQPLEAKGYEVIETDDTQQKEIQAAIYDREFGIKAQSSPVSEQAIASLENGMEILVGQGAEVLVLGCTELPLAVTARDYKGVPIVDPNRVLARRLIASFAPEKLKA